MAMHMLYASPHDFPCLLLLKRSEFIFAHLFALSDLLNIASIATCTQTILDNSSNPYAQCFASSSLLTVVTEQAVRCGTFMPASHYVQCATFVMDDGRMLLCTLRLEGMHCRSLWAVPAFCLQKLRDRLQARCQARYSKLLLDLSA